MGSLVFRIAGSGGGGGTCADGSWVTGKVGSYALEFGGDGSGDFVAIPVGASTGSANGYSGSIAAWIYPTNYDNAETIYFHGDDQWDADWMRFLLHPTNGKLRLGHKVNASANWWESADTVTLNQWNHVAVTVGGASAGNDSNGSGATVKFYLNGAQSTTSGRSWAAYWINHLHSSKGHALSSIGRHVANPSGWGYTQDEFAGKIDEFGIWTEELNLGGIQALYNGGSGAACSTVSSSYLEAYYNMEEGAGNATLTDRTGNGHTGTLTGMDTGSC